MYQPAKKYLTAADAASYVGYTTNTLAQYRCRRLGPSYMKARGRVLYAVEDLDNWVESHARIEIPSAQA
ncbi:MAG: helix-turn-helix domain-containing protein [Gammaproteobacteria bacterium]|nr:helix-turn-helix domain-containing protein [Gammaproteobacteria bacterium]